MIHYKESQICPECGSLRIKYNKKVQVWNCNVCKNTFEQPLRRSLPYRGDRCTDMYPEGRLSINKYPTPIPSLRMPTNQSNKKPKTWIDLQQKFKGQNKYQSIMVFEDDPDPWRLQDFVQV